MDNQHKQITGYRVLSQDEIDGLNRIKEREADAGRMLAEIERILKELPPSVAGEPYAETNDGLRWAEMARHHLEIGFMYAIKAVARPTTGLGRKSPT